MIFLMISSLPFGASEPIFSAVFIFLLTVLVAISTTSGILIYHSNSCSLTIPFPTATWNARILYVCSAYLGGLWQGIAVNSCWFPREEFGVWSRYSPYANERYQDIMILCYRLPLTSWNQDPKWILIGLASLACKYSRPPTTAGIFRISDNYTTGLRNIPAVVRPRLLVYFEDLWCNYQIFILMHVWWWRWMMGDVGKFFSLPINLEDIMPVFWYPCYSGNLHFVKFFFRNGIILVAFYKYY